MKNIFLKTVAFMLAGIMLLGFAACNDRGLPSVNGGDEESGTRGADWPDDGENLLSRSTDLMAGVSCKTVNSRPADDRFIKSQAEFGLALFKESMKDGVNSLVSPLSVTLALAMTANGASGETLAEMEKLLGGDIPIDELNEYLHTYVSRLPSDEKAKLNIANSIWFKDDEDSLVVNKDFLQRNADYYGASAYKSPFDDSTVSDINGWVNENTDGMIKKLLDNIPEEAVMYLINAICFDAEWSNPFTERDIRPDDFHGVSGTVKVDMMNSTEHRFVSDENARGFIKYYTNGYSFMAILPNEGIGLSDYIRGLDGDGLVRLYKRSESVSVSVTMPKFKYEYTTSLNDPLKKLGMREAFEGGFSRMGECKDGPLSVSSVLHKTFIEVDNAGTRAAAVTAVIMAPTSANPEYVRVERVKLDRPFLYAIVDNATGLPIFIGTVNDIEG